MMQYYRYSKGIHVDHESISLKEALDLVQYQETASTNKDNYLGFSYEDSDATIQFVRKSLSEWILDVPFYRDGEFLYAKDAIVSHRVVLDLVTRFFDPEDPITKSLRLGEHKEFEQSLEREYGIVLKDVDLEKELNQVLNEKDRS